MLRNISYDRIMKILVNTMSVIITLQRHHNYMYYGCGMAAQVKVKNDKYLCL